VVDDFMDRREIDHFSGSSNSAMMAVIGMQQLVLHGAVS
jgi:hypothetical protein